MIDLANLRCAVAMLDPDLRWRWAGLIALNIVAALLEAVGALGVYWLIGIVSNPESAADLPIVGSLAGYLGLGTGREQLIGFSVGIMVFYAAKNAFLLLNTYFQASIPFTANVRVSTALLQGYLTVPYAFHFHRNSAEITRNVITSVDIVFRTVLLAAVATVGDTLIVVAVLSVLLAAAPLETLLAGGTLWLLTIIVLRLTHSRVAEWGKKLQGLAKTLFKIINQVLGALKDVKILNREGYFLEDYHKTRADQSDLLCLYETLQNVPRLALETLFTFLLAALIIMVTVGNRDPATIVPLLGLFAYAGFRLMPSLARITANLQKLGFGAEAVKQVYGEYQQIVGRSPEPSMPVAAMPFVREIRIEDVSYTYPRGTSHALNGVSLTVPHRSSLGVVGATGAGKSTLIDILLGLLHPDSGRVLVDGADIAVSLRAWQRNIGFVPQMPYLLDDSLYRNIAFGVPDADIDKAAVSDAVRMAQLGDLVSSLPQGLETEIGERGVRLSGGQRQRVAIARALYRRPEVLVFDEATSALDNLTERELTAAIDAISGEKTIIIIAHRMTTVRNCDSIVFLAGGQIRDYGHYDELLGRNPEFRRLAMAENLSPAESA